MTDEILPVQDTPALPVAAVFLDVASMPGDEAEDLARILGALGTVCRPARRIAYADWAELSDLRGVAHRHGFDQVQTTEIEPGPGWGPRWQNRRARPRRPGPIARP
jgi:hypothetical protein